VYKSEISQDDFYTEVELMSNLDKRILGHLEKLCRIRCTPEEEKELLHSLGKILDYIHQLNEIETSHVPACNDLLKNMAGTILREDTVSDLMSREQFLANAPDKIGEMIRVPPVKKIP
jgi:aspartyl-tRNA(Asn)/glutamyl-tRNA(Gln) amidotransferase subunit C